MKMGFIGAGKVGKALGLYFKNHDLDTAGYCSKTLQSSQEAARLTGTKAFDTIEALADACEVLFITTPDHILTDIDSQVSGTLNGKPGGAQKTFIHVSGAYTSDCLKQIRAAGCAAGSMHPLQSFGDPQKSAVQLEKTYFSIEGAREAQSTIQNILEKTGGRYSVISAEHKPLYHAGACVLSNYLVTLLDSGIRYLEAAGMDRETLFQAVVPLITGTLDNIREKGTVEALTGPIVRGDFDTVSLHLEAIKRELPSELELYRAMALKTAAMVRQQRLTAEQAEIIQKLMKGSGSDGQQIHHTIVYGSKADERENYHADSL